MEKQKYEIPRNVKAGGLFLKLDLKRWLLFIAISSFFILIIVWGFSLSLTRLLIGALGIVMTYFSLEVDEMTGESNISGVVFILEKVTTKGKLTPKWGGNEYEETKKLVHFTTKTKK